MRRHKLSKLLPESPTLVFLSFYDSNYSRSATIFNFEDRNLNKMFIQIPTGIRLLVEIWKLAIRYRNSDTIYIVMSPSHLLVLFLRFLTFKPIVLDAGWPLLDGYKTKGSMMRDLLNRTKIWLVDFLTFHSSNLVLFESRAQCNYSKRRYLLNESKIAVSYTGFDETQVVSSQGKGMKSRISLPESPYVLFRGKVNDEAGLQNIINAFSKYDVIAPLVILTNRDLNLDVGNGRIKVVKNFVSMQEMSDLYNGAALCLGQLSSHPRLARTIPHKAFEAGFYGVPYISIKSVAILEIYPNEKICRYLDNDSPKEIAQAVNEILSDVVLAQNYAREIQNVYRLNISQERIHLDFIETLTGKGFK